MFYFFVAVFAVAAAVIFSSASPIFKFKTRSDPGLWDVPTRLVPNRLSRSQVPYVEDAIKAHPTWNPVDSNHQPSMYIVSESL